MIFTIEQAAEPTVMVLAGDVLGGADALEFTRAISDLIRDGARTVIVDLGQVELMNSSGLGMLVSASGALRAAGGAMSIASASDKIQGLFRMTRLDAVLVSYATRDEAIAACR